MTASAIKYDKVVVFSNERRDQSFSPMYKRAQRMLCSEVYGLKMRREENMSNMTVYHWAKSIELEEKQRAYMTHIGLSKG